MACSRKLSPAAQLEIRRGLATGRSARAIARDLGVSHTTIGRYAQKTGAGETLPGGVFTKADATDELARLRRVADRLEALALDESLAPADCARAAAELRATLKAIRHAEAAARLVADAHDDRKARAAEVLAKLQRIAAAHDANRAIPDEEVRRAFAR